METMLRPLHEQQTIPVSTESDIRRLSAELAASELASSRLIDICSTIESWDHEQARRLNNQMQIRTLLALAPGIDQNVRYRMSHELDAITTVARKSGLDELQRTRTISGAERDWSISWDHYAKLIKSPTLNQASTPNFVDDALRDLSQMSKDFAYFYPRQESQPRSNMAAAQNEVREVYTELTPWMATVLHTDLEEADFRLIAQRIGRLNFTPNADNRALDGSYLTDWRNIWQGYMDLMHRKYELLVRRTAMTRNDRTPSLKTVAYRALVQRIAYAPNQTLKQYTAELPQFADPLQSQPLTTLATLAHNSFVSIAAPSSDPDTWQLAPRHTHLEEDALIPLKAIEI